MKKNASYIISVIIIAAVLILGYFLFPGEKNKNQNVDQKIENKDEVTVTIPEEYDLIKDTIYENIKLTDGKGSDDYIKITLIPELSVAGDLNNDAKKDLVIISNEDGGGSGNFKNVAIYLAGEESAYFAGKIFLGDMVRIQSLTIGEGGIINIRMLTHKEDDPLVAPSNLVLEQYKFVNGEIIELPRTDLPEESGENAQ